MQIIQKFKTYPQLLLLSLLLCVAQTAPVFASGDAYFSLSPSSGSHTVGSTFSVTVYETSSASDNTEGTDANLTYTSSLLQYTGISTGAFPICPSPSGGGGSVSVACATGSALSGTQSVATISFKVLGSGTASVHMVGSGSTATDIQNSSYQSVWNGSLPSASFSLTSASSPSGGSSHPSTGSNVSSKSANPTPNPAPKPATTNPKTTPTTSTQSQTTTKPPVLSYVTIIVTDTTGQPIKGAKVVFDGNYTVYSDSQGKANFTTENSGSHNVTITDPGKKPYQTKVSLTAGQSVPIELQLTSAKSNGWMYAVAGILGLLILAGVLFMYFRPKLPWAKRSILFTPPLPIMSGGSAQAPVSAQPVMQPVPAKNPDQTQPAPQQRSYYLRRRDSFDGIRGRH